MELKADIAIVGGGLAGCLTAIRFANAKPDLRVVIIEATERLGGHKTWMFRESDLAADSLSWVKPLVEKSWASSDVSFPRMQRSFDGNSFSFRSEALHAYVMRRLGENVMFKSNATRLTESHVELGNDKVLSARCVIDARGMLPQDQNPPPNTDTGEASGFLCGYRKYIAKEFVLQQPHGVKSPLIIDATCPQLDGLRFFRLLPWDDDRLVVEEIYYSNNADCNPERIGRSLESYVERHSWKIHRIEREESGVRPIPMTSGYLTSSVGGEPLPLGLRGGYFHAMTGETLPDAVRIADFLASLEDPTTQAARDGLMRFRRSWLSRQRYYRLLNRLMFHASEPSLRYLVLQNFYEQPLEVISRFSASRTTWSDRMRILSGRPPVPLERALKSLREKSVQSWPEMQKRSV